MKATLYEALAIPQGATDEEVRAALRRLIRKYYAKTRDGQRRFRPRSKGVQPRAHRSPSYPRDDAPASPGRRIGICLSG